MVFSGGFAEWNGNGDGTLFYPGEDKVYPDQDRGYAGPALLHPHEDVPPRHSGC